MNRSHWVTAWALILLLGALASRQDEERTEVGGTDYGVCLDHPETCRAENPELYATVHGRKP
jgi:hypothetical protein